MLFVDDGRRWMRAMIWTLAAFVLIELIMMAAVAITAHTMDAPERADCMIVLGGGLDRNTGEPLSTLAYRLDRAVGLFDEGYAPAIIVSGGQGADEIISEAESMRNYLLRHGVPENAIIMEAQSTTTRENMAYSKAIMDENGYKSALIVTSDYHLWRAMQLADRAGISGSCAGARNSSNIFFTVKNLARETLSWIKFALTD